MLHQLLQTFAPYSKLTSIVGKLSTIGYTGYTIRQFWTNEESENKTLIEKLSLSSLYLLHMSSMSLTTAVLFGSSDVAPATATAFMGITALIKSYGELTHESNQTHTLKQRQFELQKALEKQNLDIEKMHIILEDLKDAEHEINLQEQSLSALMKIAEQLRTIKNQPTKAIVDTLKISFSLLKVNAKNEIQKAHTIGEYFASRNFDDFDVDGCISKLSEETTRLNTVERSKNQKKETNPESINRQLQYIQTTLNNQGILQQQCIKYKKIRALINKCKKQLEQKEDLTPLTTNYFSHLVSDLTQRVESWKTLHQTISHARIQEIAEMSFETSSDEEVLSLKSKVAQNIKLQIDYLKNEINNKRQRFIEKREQYAQLSCTKLADLPRNLSDMIETIKGMVETQNKLALATLEEKSKRTNVSFTTISSFLALLLCLVPNGEYANILQPTMLGVGMMAGLSGLLDSHKKYLLTRKLSNEQGNTLKRLVHINGFKTDNFAGRQNLMETFKSPETHQEKKPPSFLPKYSRIAKEKAKLMMYQTRPAIAHEKSTTRIRRT